ncbi:MAG: hypothetical protein KF752_10180 [Pirellulaceae bacterium]|nr:hypothetical protein [Pirellulaceae bacterium]
MSRLEQEHNSLSRLGLEHNKLARQVPDSNAVLARSTRELAHNRLEPVRSKWMPQHKRSYGHDSQLRQSDS